MNAKLQLSLLSIAAFCLLPGTARAQPEELTVAAVAATPARCDQPEALSNLQRKVVDKASQGMTPLIRFIHGTRMMSYSLDVYETVAWLEARRAARAACGVAVAVADAPAVE